MVPWKAFSTYQPLDLPCLLLAERPRQFIVYAIAMEGRDIEKVTNFDYFRIRKKE